MKCSRLCEIFNDVPIQIVCAYRLTALLFGFMKRAKLGCACCPIPFNMLH